MEGCLSVLCMSIVSMYCSSFCVCVLFQCVIRPRVGDCNIFDTHRGEETGQGDTLDLQRKI